VGAADRPRAPAARYAQYATFHLTFLYELVWNLALAGVLVWLWRRRAVRAPGLFALYVAGYSLARIGEELLRVDPAHRILGLRLNFYVACILFVAGLAWFVRIQRGHGPSPTAVRRGGALLAGTVVVVALAGCGHGATGPAAAARAPSPDTATGGAKRALTAAAPAPARGPLSRA
jgi:Prolipoprotein diacylglyceryl transferase